MKILFVLLQYCLPHHLLSRSIGFFANSNIGLIKNPLIKLFIKMFKADMSEAQFEQANQYNNFNDFFVRALKTTARSLCGDSDAIACPADGCVSQIGDIDGGHLIQAKGKEFSITALLGGDEYLSQNFSGGKFATVYLSPKDYHRVHMPLDGQLQTMVYVPGSLFSVNQTTTELVDQLFARNERVVNIFDTNAGPMAVVMIGAMIVASIETVWAGQITPYKKIIRTTHFPGESDEVNLNKGDEMGRFKLGSTVIILFGPDMAEWEQKLQAGSTVKMGQRIGTLING